MEGLPILAGFLEQRVDFGAHNEALFSRPVWLGQEKKGGGERGVPGTRADVNPVLIQPALNLQVETNTGRHRRLNKNSCVSNGSLKRLAALCISLDYSLLGRQQDPETQLPAPNLDPFLHTCSG